MYPTLAAVILLFLQSIPTRAASGRWDTLLTNIGISAMHMQLLHTDRVVIFDRTDFGRSNISLPDGRCRRDSKEQVVPVDCTAHSVEYNVAANRVRPLMVLTDVWCSSGAVSMNGTLVQTGGFNDGDHAVRIYSPCRDNTCDWREIGGGLSQRRWYATNHILPDGRQIIIGGRRQFNYEFYPKKSATDGPHNLPFLVQTNDPRIENNLYPFVFLNTDGNLFIFANNKAVLLDYSNGAVIRSYPEIPGGDPRSYPSTGSAVLLPLLENTRPRVLVCGGAPKGSHNRAVNGEFVAALDTCATIGVSDENPQWDVEKMPLGRVMGDMVLLPNGDVLIVNGAGRGTAGWEYGRNPVLSPVIYRPGNPAGERFEVLNGTTTPRMYHSTAVLLRDGRVLVGGSNPHTFYNFTGVLFPTDLTLQAFSPPYLAPESGYRRPTIIGPVSHYRIGYGQRLVVRFSLPPQHVDFSSVAVTMYAPPFTTHSFSMNQRLLVLTQMDVRAVGRLTYQTGVRTPGSGIIAPPGYYLLFVIHRGIPSEGIWIQIN